jgi:hypothetical protein|tara:strand:+ start:93 stop:314 length:222 start_codon:yes stop_codon:yes gene_type:complete
MLFNIDLSQINIDTIITDVLKEELTRSGTDPEFPYEEMLGTLRYFVTGPEYSRFMQDLIHLRKEHDGQANLDF